MPPMVSGSSVVALVEVLVARVEVFFRRFPVVLAFVLGAFFSALSALSALYACPAFSFLSLFAFALIVFDGWRVVEGLAVMTFAEAFCCGVGGRGLLLSLLLVMDLW